MVLKDFIYLVNKDKRRKDRLKATQNIAVGMGIVATAGIATGILIAPKSGKETRENMKNKTVNTVETIKDKVQDLAAITKEEVTNKFYEAKEKAEDAKKDIKDNYNEFEDDAKEKTEEVKKDIKEGYDNITKDIKKTSKNISSEVEK